MIPKYLKIKGLYSYQKEQEIDFDPLTDASLFGIFGAVGSGKSSILEAITFALYGDTERLNMKGDDRTYNMMNLRSDDLLIDFECVAGKNADRYKFVVKGKRNSKVFKDVKTFERKAYIWKEEAWVPLAEHETTESIIGLSYDNFRRTIIIPQGRFQEFIELKDAERTKMMKELFQLEKYDLSRNVGSLSKKNDNALSNLDGQLSGLGEVTSEMIENEEKIRQEVRLQIKTIQEELLVLTGQLEQMQRLKLVFEKVQLLQNQLTELESKRPEIEERQETLRVFEICSLHFKIYFEQKKSLSAAIFRDRQLFDKNILRGSELETLLTKQTEIITELKDQYEKREELLDLAGELEKVIQILDYQILIEKNTGALTRGEERLKEKEEAIVLLKRQKQSKDEENEQRKSQLTDIHELSQVKSWFATCDEMQENRKAVLANGLILKEEVSDITKLLMGKIGQANQSFSINILPDSNLEVILDVVQNYLNENGIAQENLAKQIITSKTQLALHQYASNLIAGEPCPLCGSEHHPAVLHEDHTLSNQISGIENQRNHLQKLDQSIRRFQSVIEKDFGQIENLERQLVSMRTRLKEIDNRIIDHNSLFVWTKFDKNDRKGFDEYFSKAEKTQKEIKENEALIKKISADIEAGLLEKVEKIEKPLQNLKNDILRIENTIFTLSGQLEKVELSTFSGQDKSVILEKIKALKSSYEAIKQLYEKTEKEIDILEKEKNTISGSQATLLATLETNQEQLAQVQVTINNQLKIYDFDSENSVNEILQKAIQITSERKILDEFKLTLNNTKRDLENLQFENQDQIYEAEKHDVFIKTKDELTVSLNALRKEEGRLEGLLKKMAEDLAKKALLLKEKSRLQLRKEHLDDLARLFRSSGFVDYASSIYLQNLIQTANHRFHQMTHQQLHLELGEGNSFWVRDLLNGGHMRLLKTLSGGQKFQAALSLALALADHIHIRNESKHNFFFLDEGFGSLDKNALQTVFETLKSLRKENRIVGIISHVEDLQQEIQTYLRIEESEEGSKILTSWG